MEDVSNGLIAGLKRGGVAVESGHRESGSATDPQAQRWRLSSQPSSTFIPRILLSCPEIPEKPTELFTGMA